MAVPRLRVKTGCQTCRTRKKKCDEARPTCQRCKALGWRCTWPTSEELVDRRQKSAPRRKSHPAIKDEPSPEEQQQWDWEEGQLSLTSSPTSFEELAQDIKPMLFDHFNDKYFQLILLPSCHPEYSYVTFNEIATQLPDCRGLQYTVLANAASHLYSIGKSGSMKELALIYYSQALRDLHQLLETAAELETDNGLLMSVILLYTLGSTSIGTYSDVPRHLGAAVKIVTLRMFQARAAIRPTVLPAFDRLLLESVLNAMFTVSLGLWSEPFDSDDAFQPSFWLHAERLLNHSDLSPPPPTGLRNPVVGIPVALLKLFLLIRQLLSDLNGTDIDTIRDLKLEVASWESSIDYCSAVDHANNDDGELGTPHLQMAQDAASLFIVCISVLTEQLLLGDSNINIPLPHDPESWQMRLARSVMEKYSENAIWARFFNINMAVYTLGYFVARDHDIDLIRRDLQRRWDHTNFGLTLRYRKDLEITWASRGLGG